jgi:hypothetical protein
VVPLEPIDFGREIAMLALYRIHATTLLAIMAAMPAFAQDVPVTGLQKEVKDLKEENDRLKRELRATRAIATVGGRLGLDETEHVTQVMLFGRQVTDAELAHLSQFTQLKSLILTGTLVTDAGLANLESLTELELLHLSRSNPNELSDTNISDTGLKELAKLPKLKELSLQMCRVTDEGLKNLASLQNLESINVMRTKVTAKGIEEFKQAHPKCRIIGAGIEAETPKDQRPSLLLATGSGKAVGKPITKQLEGRTKVVDNRLVNNSGDELAQLTKKYESVNCFAFSPDGKMLAVGIRYDSTISNKSKDGTISGYVRIYDALTGALLRERREGGPKGLIGPVEQIAFSDDGNEVLFEIGKYQEIGGK